MLVLSVQVLGLQKVRGLTLVFTQKHFNSLYQPQETKNKQNTPKDLQRQNTVENQYKLSKCWRILQHSWDTNRHTRQGNIKKQSMCIFICIWFDKYTIYKSLRHVSHSYSGKWHYLPVFEIIDKAAAELLFKGLLGFIQKTFDSWVSYSQRDNAARRQGPQQLGEPSTVITRVVCVVAFGQQHSSCVLVHHA